ncbi:MAG: SDR family oxidoreductase [Nitrospinota bacterium]|nr:SDR family oxidoreductase [Nitrospinota bacterium]
MSENLFSVNDSVVVITGGLGQLGRRYTQTLMARGARVAIFDVGVEETRLPPDLHSAREGGRLFVLEADVTDRGSLEAALGSVEGEWGIPDGLINNAALDSPPDAPIEENGPFETYPEASWDKVMSVNVKGVFQACQVIGGRMAEAGRGSIINVSSIYGLVSPDQGLYAYRREAGDNFFKPVAYSASKSALFNLTRYLATYWGGKGVRVNTVTFGGVFNDQDENFLKNYNRRVPLGRMARPEDYEGAIVFLLSEASSYMTGSNLVIDGGWTAW